LFGDEYIGGLQVPVSDAFLMRRIQSIQNLRCAFDGPFQRHRSFERISLDELHHQIVRSDVVKLADMGMVQGRYRPGLMIEAFGELFLGDLDRDNAAQPCVPGAVHVSHATRPDVGDDFIRAESVAGNELHIPESVQFS
jgi:hypothetical protein